MGNFEQTKAELKHLPFILGKLIGGLTAVIGFTAAVIKTRTPGWSLTDILIYLLMGLIGGIIFTLSARALTRRLSGHPIDQARGMTALSWGLLLILALIFLAVVYFFTT